MHVNVALASAANPHLAPEEPTLPIAPTRGTRSHLGYNEATEVRDLGTVAGDVLRKGPWCRSVSH